MKRFKVILLLFIMMMCAHAQTKEPRIPTVAGDSEETASKERYNITVKKEDGFFYKGYIENSKGFYLNDLTWEGNESGNRKIMIDFVKSIRVMGYKINIKTFDQLSLVYYVPHLFDIELKDGNMIKNASGVIRQFDSFDVYDETGKEKMFTYFVRYWQEDKQQFSDNQSPDFDELPEVPKATVTFIEFLK